jgi:hypothetical protein
VNMIQLFLLYPRFYKRHSKKVDIMGNLYVLFNG